MKSNHFIVGSLVVIALSIAYYLLLYLPKQQEINLRKQTHELCVKEWDENLDNVKDVLARQYPTEETKQELIDKFTLVLSKKDEFLANCVDKRLQGYQEEP